MSDHEFEKKVQQRMDELKLRPSDAVWAEVERNLRRDKRRRRTLLWLPLMGILLTAGGFYIFTGKNKPGNEELVKSQPAARTENPPASVAPSASSIPPATQPAEPKTSSSPVSATPKNNDNPSANNSTLSDNKKSSVSIRPIIEKIVRTPKEQSTDLDAVTVQGKRSSKDNTEEKNITDKKTIPQVKEGKEVKEQKVQVDSNAIVTNFKVAHPAIDATDKLIAAINAPSKLPVPEEKVRKRETVKLPSIAKWQWGVNVNGGMANISEGNLFDVLKSVRVDDLANASPGPSYAGIPPVPSPEASPITPGLSFTMGAFIQRKFTKGFSLSAGLQYSYLTVNTKVGQKVNSQLLVNYGYMNSTLTDRYYSGYNSLNDYTNRYHFVELPVMASMRILHIKKAPIVLDAGLSVSRLLNTNALHWDGLNRVYYEDDNFFNRTQIALNGGLNIGLLQRSKHPLWIGPNLRYFATTLLKKEVTASETKQHLWTFGLNAKMLLKK